MRRFFLAQTEIKGDRVWLPAEQARHALRVLRLGCGDEVEMLDETGRIYQGRICRVEGKAVQVNVTDSRPAPVPSLDICLALSLTKGSKMDFTMAKSVELGVGKLLPFTSERSVVRLDGSRAMQRQRRWEQIVQEATKQCGAVPPPRVLPLTTASQLARMNFPDTVKVLFWEEEKKRSWRTFLHQTQGKRKWLLTLGPEGGFDLQEVEDFVNHGFIPVSLAPRILRSETAALVALSTLQFLKGDMG